MGRGAFLKTSFNAGELSPLLDGRSDLEKYPQGCSLLENFIPTVQGPIYHRPGTQFVDNLGGSNPVLVPFVYNRDQAYVLAIGSVIRVYADRGVVESSPGVPYTFGAGVWSAPPRRADGSSRLSYTQSGDVLFVCDAEGGFPLMQIKRHGHTSWTVEPYALANPPLEDWNSGTCVLYLELADGTNAPAGEFYMAVDIGKIQWTTADPPTATHGIGLVDPTDPEENPFKIDRRGKIALNLASSIGETATVSAVYTNIGRIVQNNPSEIGASPFYAYQLVFHNGRMYKSPQFGLLPALTHEENNDYTTYQYIGNGTFVFEILESGISDVFKDHVGTEHNIYCARVRIAPAPENEFRDPSIFGPELSQSVIFGVDLWQGGLVAGRASTHLKCGKWAFVAVRDVLPDATLPTAGVAPDNVAIFRERLALGYTRDAWLSQAGGFDNFNRQDGAGQVVADSGMALTLLSGDLSPVSWMVASDRLVLGSPGGERAIGEQNISNAFGPTNVKVDVTAATGSVDVGPALVGRDILMLDRTGRRLIRTGLTQDGQGFANLSALADHLGLASPFIAMAWREVPTPVLFLASAAGQLVGCTFEPSQDVASWHRHNLGGLVRDVVAIPSLDGTRDDLWLLVERTILGNQVFYLEVMPDDYRMGLQVEDARYLDSSVSYTGAPADEFTGLGHLEGEQVQAVGDGFVYTGLTVHLGAVTLPQEHEKVTIGKYQPARVRTMRLHLGADDGVNMGKNARLTKASARMVDTVNIRAGGDFVNMNRLDFRDGGQAMDIAVPSQSEERTWSPRGGYSTEAYLCLEQDQPLPATIVSLGLEFEVN